MSVYLNALIVKEAHGTHMAGERRPGQPTSPALPPAAHPTSVSNAELTGGEEGKKNSCTEVSRVSSEN